MVDVKTQEQGGRSREGKSKENTDVDDGYDDGTSRFSLFIAAGGSRAHTVSTE